MKAALNRAFRGTRSLRWLTGLVWVAAAGLCSAQDKVAAGTTAEGVDFFEKRIRPLLAERCFECHSTTAKKVKGGLRLDSREDWTTGGDSGPALVPGDLDKSLLIKAVRYTDQDLKMPPKQKLTDEQIADFEKWVKMGAPDPRTTATAGEAKKGFTSVEAGRKFWSFQPPKKSPVPVVKDKGWARTDIDRFILARQEEKGLHPAADADRATLIRRAYYDLIGLPPTAEQTDAFMNDKRSDAFERVIDELLASPHFGERWGRHWLDVARFAESSGGGRTLLFPEAWRYRDYVIDAFNNDLPYDQFLQEQLAGDLLNAEEDKKTLQQVQAHGPIVTSFAVHAEQIAKKRRRITATAFLALGPTNYEEQDKQMLRMDIVDEQLDTMGKAMLGMTIGCARCHDHKFDPIPTRDYYAMAAILRSTRTLHNFTDNVAKWVDTPLPMEQAKEVAYRAQEKKVAQMEAQIAAAKAVLTKSSSKVAKAELKKGMPVAPEDLPGIVVDDTKAKVVGAWQHSQYSHSYVGDGYLHDGNSGKGEKTLTFVPELKRPGKYEVRLAYVYADNRSEDIPVTVFHADGEQTVHINEKQTPPIDGRFVSLGQFRFEQNGAGYVLVSNDGTKGVVVADAVQFLPVEEVSNAETAAAPKDKDAVKKASEMKKLEAELKKLKEAGPKRDVAMSVSDSDEIGDYHVCIRGNFRNEGEKVARGFLQVATVGEAPAIPAAESGRRQLAEWVANPANPLTARVMANRVWHWLTGAGIVRTVDNFGTTGELPSHPELLDYLAIRFVEEGWSVKKLVKEVMLSRTYQLGTQVAGEGTASKMGGAAAPPYRQLAAQVDPENRLLSHANRRRLDAECIRDTILMVSGQLRLDVGGPNIQVTGPVNGVKADPVNSLEYSYRFTDTRRSLYTPAFRNNRLELFEVFDFGDINQESGRRNTSTVATQALYLMNHPFIMEQAKLAATKALAVAKLDDATRIERAYRASLGREPTVREKELALRFVTEPAGDGKPEEARLKAWAQFYQTLFACMDFRYIN